MNEDFSISQGEGLRIVSDLAMSGGICFAITSQWAFLGLRGESYDTEVVTGQTFKRQKGGGSFAPLVEKTVDATVQKGFFSLVSLQRGYDLIDLRLADKMDAGQQDVFFKTASEFSEKYLDSLSKREGFKLAAMQTFKSVDEVVDKLAFDKSAVDLIGIFGIEKGHNWGHVVASGNNGKCLFFDANSGQFSGLSSDIRDDIASYLKSNYDGIQNCALYTIAK